MSAHTPGPWVWARMGDWKLIGNHGMRPIVLACWGKRKAQGPPAAAEFKLRDAARDLMTDFDPEHPDARLIAAAPELLARLKYEHAKAAPFHGNFDIEGCEGCTIISKAEGR